MKSLDVFAYVVVYFIGALILVATFDFWLMVPFVAWLVCYILALRYFMPKMAIVARRQADARSLMTGRIVDSYTNISTVKLFAHAGREHAAAEGSIRAYRERAFAFGRVAWMFRTGLATLGGILPVALIGLAIYLWQTGSATPGTIALAGLISTQL